MDYLVMECKDSRGKVLALKKCGNHYNIGYIGDDIIWAPFKDLAYALPHYQQMVELMARGLYSDEDRCKMLKEACR